MEGFWRRCGLTNGTGKIKEYRTVKKKKLNFVWMENYSCVEVCICVLVRERERERERESEAGEGKFGFRRGVGCLGAIKTPLPPKIVEISLVKMTKNF